MVLINLFLQKTLSLKDIKNFYLTQKKTGKTGLYVTLALSQTSLFEIRNFVQANSCCYLDFVFVSELLKLC